MDKHIGTQNDRTEEPELIQEEEGEFKKDCNDNYDEDTVKECKMLLNMFR